MWVYYIYLKYFSRNDSSNKGAACWFPAAQPQNNHSETVLTKSLLGPLALANLSQPISINLCITTQQWLTSKVPLFIFSGATWLLPYSTFFPPSLSLPTSIPCSGPRQFLY